MTCGKYKYRHSLEIHYAIHKHAPHSVYVCNFFKGNEESKKEIKVAPG
jgi:hypothetical protein